MARVTMPAGEVTIADGTLAVRGVRLALLRPNRTPTGAITVAPQRMLDPAADPDVYVLATSEPLPPDLPEHPLTLAELRASVHRVIGTDLPITAATGPAARSPTAGRRRRTGPDGSCSPATPRRCSPPAAPPSTPAGWTRSISAGNWPPPPAAPLRRACSTRTTPNATPPHGARSCTRAPRRPCRCGENAEALREVLTDVLRHPGPLAHLAAPMEGSDVRHGPGPLIGAWAPDVLDGPAATSAISQLHSGRPLVIDTTDGAGITTTTDPWRQRLDVVALPGAGPSALIRPDGYRPGPATPLTGCPRRWPDGWERRSGGSERRFVGGSV